MEVLADHHITSESVFPEISEQDLVDMKLVVGQKIVLEYELAKIEDEFCEPKEANTLPHKTDHISVSTHETPPQASSPSNDSNGPEGK